MTGGTVSGTVTLDLWDPVWDGAPSAAALYVHRMAVRRSAAGLGAAILDWAAGVARERDLEALRLDCVASNRPRCCRRPPNRRYRCATPATTRGARTPGRISLTWSSARGN